MTNAMHRAVLIYDTARTQALVDHMAECRKFEAGEIDVLTPCGMDRERSYIIQAFAKELEERSG